MFYKSRAAASRTLAAAFSVYRIWRVPDTPPRIYASVPGAAVTRSTWKPPSVYSGSNAASTP